jgi:ankyrin repeat protein
MGVGRWLWGNDDTMRCLQAENFDFRSPEAAEAVDRLKRNRASNTKLLLALAAAGAGSGEEIVLRRALIDAHSKHDPDAARQLLKMANVDMSLLALAADVGIPVFMAEALKIEKDVDKRDWRGLTLLMIAVSRRQSVDQSSDIDRAWTARLLLEAGADANLTDKDGNTPLLLNRYDAGVVQYLLQAGAKIDARNNAGETALMRAETPELTRILLLNHADPSLRDAAGETALDIAKREHNDVKVAVLTDQKLQAPTAKMR